MFGTRLGFVVVWKLLKFVVTLSRPVMLKDSVIDRIIVVLHRQVNRRY